MTRLHRGAGEISTRSCEAGSECRLAGLAGCWAGYYVRYPVGGEVSISVRPSLSLSPSMNDGNFQPPAHALPRCQKCILSLFGLGRFRAVQMDLTASPARPRQMAQTAEYGKQIAEWKLLQESKVIAVTTVYTLPTGFPLFQAALPRCRQFVTRLFVKKCGSSGGAPDIIHEPTCLLLESRSRSLFTMPGSQGW